MFIPLVSHCELSKWAGPEVGYLLLEQQPRQRTDVCRRRNKRPKSEGTAGGEKKEMRRGKKKKKPRGFQALDQLFALCKQSALNLPRVCSSIKGSHLLFRCSWHCCIRPGMHLGHRGKAVLPPFPVKHLGSALLSACLCLCQVRNRCQIIPVVVAWRG